jgi:hypothetical protein
MKQIDRFAELLSEHTTPEDAAAAGVPADPGGDVRAIAEKLGITTQYGHTLLYKLRTKLGFTQSR